MEQQGVTSILLMTALLVLIYFMMIRPQRKKDKADREMRANLKVGDEIITIGGVIGKIEKINDKSVVISTTSAKNKIEFLKTAIASVGKPNADETSAAKPAKEEAKEEKKAPNRDKKVTPKKLGKKEEKPAAAEAAEEVRAEVEVESGKDA